MSKFKFEAPVSNPDKTRITRLWKCSRRVCLMQLSDGLSAAVEMAKAMVSMKLKQAPKAYPSDGLKAKPEFC